MVEIGFHERNDREKEKTVMILTRYVNGDRLTASSHPLCHWVLQLFLLIINNVIY